MGPWVILGLAILTEVFATTSLRIAAKSDGAAQVLWYGAMAVGYGLSFIFLSMVLKKLDLGISYAVWAGIGTALTAVIGIVLFGEPATAIKFACIALIIVGAVGLNLSGASH